MQASQQIPIDIVLVVQSVIVLLIAAPPLVRTVFRLPKPGSLPKIRRTRDGGDQVTIEHAQAGAPNGISATAPIVREKAIVRSLKIPIVLDVFAVAALVFAFGIPRRGSSTFGLSTSTDFFQIPPVTVPTVGTVVVVTILLIALAVVAICTWPRSDRQGAALARPPCSRILFLFAVPHLGGRRAAVDARARPAHRQPRAGDAARSSGPSAA